MSISRRLFFSFWYFRKPPWDTGVSPPELMEHIHSHPPGKALDMGCGTGTNVITLAQHGWRATGADFARRAIQIARKKARQANVEATFKVGDVTNIEESPEGFNLILDMGCYHSLNPKDRQAYRKKLIRLLAQQGTYLLYAFIGDVNSGGATGIFPMDIKALSSELELVTRKDGSERGRLPSAWFTFKKALQNTSRPTETEFTIANS
jgi:cyclopropane fatty-acyl-phospholipid synthase-like methyltransferase